MKNKKPLLIAILAFIGSITFMMGGIYTSILNYDFRTRGQHVTGTVDATQILYGKHTEWLASYHFSTPAGIQSIMSQTIGNATYGSLSQNGPVPVVYLPDNTAVCRIDLPSEEKYQGSLTGSIFGTLLFAGVGCIAFVSGHKLT